MHKQRKVSHVSHLITPSRGLAHKKGRQATASYSGADKAWRFVVVLTVNRAAVGKEQY
jgi:hypothetical protein